MHITRFTVPNTHTMYREYYRYYTESTDNTLLRQIFFSTQITHIWTQKLSGYVLSYVPYGRFSLLTVLTKSLARVYQCSKPPASYDGSTPSVALAIRTPLPSGQTSSRTSPRQPSGETSSTASDSHLAMQQVKVYLSMFLEFRVFHTHTHTLSYSV